MPNQTSAQMPCRWLGVTIRLVTTKKTFSPCGARQTLRNLLLASQGRLSLVESGSLYGVGSNGGRKTGVIVHLSDEPILHKWISFTASQTPSISPYSSVQTSALILHQGSYGQAGELFSGVLGYQGGVLYARSLWAPCGLNRHIDHIDHRTKEARPGVEKETGTPWEKEPPSQGFCLHAS